MSAVVPPWYQPPSGFEAYMPEDFYFSETEGFPAVQAAHVIARCAVRWADFYRAGQPFRTAQVREGPLPEDRAAREELIDDLFAWFGEAPDFGGELTLLRGEIRVLDGHDGFPCMLILTPDQFAELQGCLEAAGFPRDLYYRLSQRRCVVEPVEVQGHVLLGYVRYSPLSWAHRDVAAIAARRIPSEEERRKAFSEATRHYLDALMLRWQELREPGKDRRSDELRQIDYLRRYVNGVLLSVGQPNRAPREKSVPSAGWHGVPTVRQALKSAVPVLRRLRPNGQIQELSSHDLTMANEVCTWGVQIWDAGAGISYDYDVMNGVVMVPPVEYRTDRGDRLPIVRLTTGRIPAFLDSPEAIQRAWEGGAEEFCERTDSRMAGLSLTRGRSGRLFWKVQYRNNNNCAWASAQIVLDARTGEIVDAEYAQSSSFWKEWKG